MVLARRSKWPQKLSSVSESRRTMPVPLGEPQQPYLESPNVSFYDVFANPMATWTFLPMFVKLLCTEGCQFASFLCQPCLVHWLAMVPTIPQDDDYCYDTYRRGNWSEMLCPKTKRPQGTALIFEYGWYNEDLGSSDSSHMLAKQAHAYLPRLPEVSMLLPHQGCLPTQCTVACEWTYPGL